MRPLAGQYYVVLRSVLRTAPHLRQCLNRCRHCRIFFLTHPRNAGRVDLRCPFGCREAHRKRRSTQRSVEYYGTDQGKVKKKIQNGKRSQAEARAGDERLVVGEQPLSQEGMRLDAQIVSYVWLVTSLIEGRRVSEDEIVEMLRRALRQHRMARGRRMDYVVAYLKKNAP